MAEQHSHYLDYEDLRGDGRIVIYKRADHKRPRYTARLKIPNNKGFVVRSTRTLDYHEARRFAEDLYYELEGRARRGERVSFRSLEMCLRIGLNTARFTVEAKSTQRVILSWLKNTSYPS